MFGLGGFSQAPFSTAFTGVQFANGNISGIATVTANGFSNIFSSASITTTANVTALGGLVYYGIGSINTETTVTAFPVAIYSRNAFISGNALIEAIGTKFGYNWNGTTAGSETWTDVSAGSNTWEDVSSGSNTWLLKG